METIADLVATAEDREGTVIDAPDRAVAYSYPEFAANSFRAGNLLGHYGVHPGSTVTVAVGPKEQPRKAAGDGLSGVPDAAESLLAILGGGSIGAVVDVTPDPPIDSRALVAPAWWDCETTPRCSHLAYGGPPTEATVAHFEAELWSENAVRPPETVDAAAPALRADGETDTHEELLSTATAVIEEFGLDGSSRVALSAPLTEPGAIVAGVLAPIAAGATILLPETQTTGQPGEKRVSRDDGADLRVVERRGEGGGENGGEDGDGAVVRAAAVTTSLRDTRRA
jgi:hypothetical protein